MQVLIWFKPPEFQKLFQMFPFVIDAQQEYDTSYTTS